MTAQSMVRTIHPYSPSPPLYKQVRERFLFLFVTNRCNLRCKHCFVGNERLNAAEEMSVPQAVELMEYFRAFGGHDKLYILGGEPSLHPNLPDIVNAGAERGYAITISTNGDFDDSFFERIPPSSIQSLNFSIDGPDEETHARIRGTRRSFHRVTNRISEAVARGYQVRLMFTVTTTNADRVAEMIEYAAELGVNTLSLHNLGRTGNAVEHQTPLSPAEWMALCRKIESLPAQENLALYYPPSFIEARQLPDLAKRGYPGCPARTLDRLYIYPDGTVYICPLLMDGGRYFARFRNGQLVPNRMPNSELDIVLKVPAICNGCSQNQTCGGGCPAFEAMPPHPGGTVECDRETVPVCMLWTTYAWQKAPPAEVHRFR